MFASACPARFGVLTMAFRDLLLPLFSYPTAQSESTLENAARLARRLGGDVTALALQIRIVTSSNRLANLLVGLDELCRTENIRNEERASEAAANWSKVAERHGLPSSVQQVVTNYAGENDLLVQAARTRDICLLSLGPQVEADQSAVEAVLFGSGRPVLVFPEAALPAETTGLNRIVVAWDGSRAAARALADAIPLLSEAREVKILTVTGEKPSASAPAASDAPRYLATHGIRAELETVEAGDQKIGAVLEGYMTSQGADLLVMGGFAHSRARDFILGGATKSILWNPAFPVFLSH